MLSGKHSKSDKTKAAQQLGKHGGDARKEVLTAKQRSEIARKAANARWLKLRKKYKDMKE